MMFVSVGTVLVYCQWHSS